jgi:miniconductance mechanosensitive channel
MIEYLLPYLPTHPTLYSLSILSILCIFSLLAFLITQQIIIKLLTKMFKKTSTELDDIFIKRKVFNRLAYIIPAIIFYTFAYTVPVLQILLQRISLGLIVFSTLMVLNAFLSALTDIYEKTKYSERMHIKSYIQIIKLIINILCTIVIIAILIGKNPTWLLSGLGAMTAVLLLVFKDTILSFVASIQINSNDLFKVGDWIEAPQFGADGDVIDIALHAVKIQNWDKTISVIPTHKLIDSAFRNWRGMSESGGRRIKRSLFIDMNSIKLCDEEMVQRFKQFHIITDYIDAKQKEINDYNGSLNIDISKSVNGRKMTNVGTFRAYIEAYLKNNSKIHPKMTFLVRQLEPTSKGLPIQIYVFTNDINWVNYEGIQADIFDHLLAIIPEFNLKVFQSPTGKDFSKIIKK